VAGGRTRPLATPGGRSGAGPDGDERGRRGGLAGVRRADGPVLLRAGGHPGLYAGGPRVQADIDSFGRTGPAVHGVSTDDEDSHPGFADAEDLSFDLLADPDGAVAESFDVEMKGDFDDRITFVPSDGAVQAVIDADTMEPEDHAAEVLEAVEAVAQ
jgi:hypothetical protein